MQAIFRNKIAKLLLNLSQNYLHLLLMQEISLNTSSPERKKRFSDYHRRQEIKQRLDSLLENDFEAMRRGNVKSDDLLLKNHNLLVMEYVKSIYDEYCIQDPLPDDSYLSRILTPSASKTKKMKKKIQLMSNQIMKTSTPNQLDSSKSKMNDKQNQSFDFEGDESTVKKDYFHNTTTIRASLSCFDTEQRDRQHSASNILPSDSDYDGLHQILRSRNKNGLEMIVEDEIKPEAEEEESSHQSLSMRIPNQIINKNYQDGEDFLKIPHMPGIQQIIHTNRQQKQYTCRLDQSFRYCIGCETSLLHANIQFHESTCMQYQQVFRLAPEEIVTYLKTKVDQFSQQIKERSRQLNAEDVDRLHQCSIRMMEQNSPISLSGTQNENFQREYMQVIDISKKWCHMTEIINKVNWFLKIRQRIKSKFQL